MNFWYSLVELLPFSWAEPGGMYFMKNALLAVLLVCPLFGLLSTMIVTKGMSFFSDALGHSVFTGMAIGAICGLTRPLWSAAAFAVFFALLFTFIRRKSKASSDTIIGALSSTAVALGIFIATFGGRSFTKFNSLLIGDILSVSPSEIGLIALLSLAVIVIWLLSSNHMTLSSIHPELAESRGISVFKYELIFSVVIALVVTVSMPWIGLMVINSLLILPAAAARNTAKNLASFHLLSVAGALAAGICGLFTSYYIGSSAGAAISLYLALYFAVCFLARPK